MAARLDRAPRARELRDRGLKLEAIAREMGISRSYVHSLLQDPDGSKDKERKHQYGGLCADCGKPTDGSNGRGKAPERCAPCASAENAVWTPEAIVLAIREWVEAYGNIPTSVDWWHASDHHPAKTTVQIRFGSWNAGIEAAGFDPNPAYSDGPGSLSAEELQRTADLYESGLTLGRVAAIVGISDAGVAVRLDKAGVKRRPAACIQKLGDVDRGEIFERWIAGETHADLARAFDVHPVTIARTIKRMKGALSYAA